MEDYGNDICCDMLCARCSVDRLRARSMGMYNSVCLCLCGGGGVWKLMNEYYVYTCLYYVYLLAVRGVRP